MKNPGGRGAPLSASPASSLQYPASRTMCATWRLYSLWPQSIAHTSRHHGGVLPSSALTRHSPLVYPEPLAKGRCPRADPVLDTIQSAPLSCSLTPAPQGGKSPMTTRRDFLAGAVSAAGTAMTPEGAHAHDHQHEH